MERYRIVLVDDHLGIRTRVKGILSRGNSLQVVSEVSDGMQLLLGLDQLKPHLVIMEPFRNGLQGIEIMTQIKMRQPAVKILVLTTKKEKEPFMAAIAAGADGYLLMEDEQEDLLLAVERIRSGKGFLSPVLSDELSEKHESMAEIFRFLLDA